MDPSVQPSCFKLPESFFYPLVALSQILVVTALVLCGYWTGHILGGFAWDGSHMEFNLHPLLMVLGMIFFYGDAILMFRIFSKENKMVVKIMHMLLQILALLCSAVGLKAVFRYHSTKSIPNMYSMHSWIGLPTFLMFGLQFIFGFVTFLFPRLREGYRTVYMPVHRYFGVAIFAMAVAAVISGINEKQFFVYNGANNGTEYKDLPGEAYVANFLGIAVMGFALTVGFLVTYASYQREDDVEWEKLPLTAHAQAEMRQFSSMDEGEAVIEQK
ncbi:transmembrane ascorbate-dependent reductase CYB561-like isoform X2 [Amphiura filiformis]|uniref:transmembrane ascorbate-dependent reductase CYB561-like isoform X2 n=1 Tax=Amphiura filiformis TaxID=82378 RepID=UPI003B217461